MVGKQLAFWRGYEECVLFLHYPGVKTQPYGRGGPGVVVLDREYPAFVDVNTKSTCQNIDLFTY